VGIQVHHRDDHVGKIVGPLAVTDQLLVIYRIEAQIPIGLQGWVLVPDAIDAPNKSEAVGSRGPSSGSIFSGEISSELTRPVLAGSNAGP
jgi:hypothetical protein